MSGQSAVRRSRVRLEVLDVLSAVEGPWGAPGLQAVASTLSWAGFEVPVSWGLFQAPGIPVATHAEFVAANPLAGVLLGVFTGFVEPWLECGEDVCGVEADWFAGLTEVGDMLARCGLSGV